MSKLKTETDKLITKLSSILTGYNCYTDIIPEGYKSPYVQVISSWSISNPTTENNKQVRTKMSVLIGRDYTQANRATIKEALQVDIEKILELAYDIEEDNIEIFEDFNKKNNTYGCILTLIK